MKSIATSRATNDFIIGIALVFISFVGIMVLIPYGIDKPNNVNIRALSPDFWPLIIFIGMGIIGFLVGLEEALKIKNSKISLTQTRAVDNKTHLPTVMRLTLIGAILFGVYFSISALGIMLSNAISIFILCYLGGERRWWLITLLSIITPSVLYLFFVNVANVPLPTFNLF